MSESPAKLAPAAKDMDAAFQSARQAGNGLAWTGFILALLWWMGSGALFYMAYAGQVFGTLSIGLLIAGGGLLFMPGLILIFAGFMARQNKRTHEANLLLLKASGHLLSPARAAIDDMTNLAEATRFSTAAINASSAEAATALQNVSDALASERLRAESVGYAMADNARELTQRLAEERKALETLSHAINEQATRIGDTIPRHARHMLDASAEAGKNLVAADLNLEKRIEHLKQASGTLATRLIDLDAVARDAANRTDSLQASITRIETTLGQSKKTVEMAERASAMAVDAAGQTGKSLQDAVSSALDGARLANIEIEDSLRRIQEASQSAMTQLRQTGVEAAQAAARVQEQSLGISQSLPKAPAHATPPASKPAAQRPDPDIFKTPDTLAEQVEQVEQVDTPSRKRPTITEVRIKPDEKRASDARRIYLEEVDPIAETRPDVETDDLFDEDPAEAVTPPQDTPPVIASKNETAPQSAPAPNNEPPMELGTSKAPIILNKTHTEETIAGQKSEEWRDIIADFSQASEQEDAARAQHTADKASPQASPREATADELMYRLQSSGIPLPTAFRSRDKKKIAAAARKDEQARRKAIRNVAGGEVDRVAIRLNKDDQLMDLARRFVTAEQAEALKALEETVNTGRHASPRLSAYLLVDAALAPMLGA